MTPSLTLPRVPDLAQRLAARGASAGPVVMYQRWHNLLFLHWQYSGAAIQAMLPEGLFVDTHAGLAYLGVVPFFMHDVRPRFLPGVPGVSNFLELNLRTYVHDRAGVPGVWFFSLDANQRLAVELARRLFHLPYAHATMQARRAPDDGIWYESVRRGNDTAAARSVFQYSAGQTLPPASPGSLEFFLVERYYLYASTPQGLRRGAVSHSPYPLREATVAAYDDHLITLNGFTSPGRPPDHCLFSPGVDVSIKPLTRV